MRENFPFGAPLIRKTENISKLGDSKQMDPQSESIRCLIVSIRSRLIEWRVQRPLAAAPDIDTDYIIYYFIIPTDAAPLEYLTGRNWFNYLEQLDARFVLIVFANT